MSKIDIEHVKEMHVKIKEQYPNWAKLVADGISKEKDWKKYKLVVLSPEGVVHIVNNKTKSQLHRRLFMLVCARLLREAAQTVEEINELLVGVDAANN